MTDVTLSLTFRHTRPTDALKEYIEEKVHKTGNIFPRPFIKVIKAHVILFVDSKDRQLTGVTLKTRRRTIHGREDPTSLNSAIDLVTHKVEQRLRKYKTKTRLRRRRIRA